MKLHMRFSDLYLKDFSIIIVEILFYWVYNKKKNRWFAFLRIQELDEHIDATELWRKETDWNQVCRDIISFCKWLLMIILC